MVYRPLLIVKQKYPDQQRIGVPVSPLHVGHHHARCVGKTDHAHEVLGGNVGSGQGCPDGIPGQAAPARKYSREVFFSFRATITPKKTTPTK